jgi:hypothetical protein
MTIHWPQLIEPQSADCGTVCLLCCYWFGTVVNYPARKPIERRNGGCDMRVEVIDLLEDTFRDICYYMF